MARIYEITLECGCLYGEKDCIHSPCESGYWEMTPEDFRGSKPDNYDLHVESNREYWLNRKLREESK